MARRRIWKNKPKAVRDKNREKNRPPRLNPPMEGCHEQRLTGQGKEERENSKEILHLNSRRPGLKSWKQALNSEIEAKYRMLSPMTQEVVDHLVATGLSMEKVINGIRS